MYAKLELIGDERGQYKYLRNDIDRIVIQNDTLTIYYFDAELDLEEIHNVSGITFFEYESDKVKLRNESGGEIARIHVSEVLDTVEYKEGKMTVVYVDVDGKEITVNGVSEVSFY